MAHGKPMNQRQSRMETVAGDSTRARIEEDDSRRTRESESRAENEARGAAGKFRMDFDAFRYQPLPDPPPIEGYHCIWLSTTHKTQSVQAFLRLGYELVKAEEVSGSGFQTQTTGQYAGHIMVNEMILAKIPTEIYYQMMDHYHHDEPNSDEQAIKDTVDSHGENAARSGGALIADEGFQHLASSGFRRPNSW